VPWAVLEPEEGQFNWSLFDTPAERWIAKGKRIALRVTCSESWMRYATPKWVQDAGANGVDYEWPNGPKEGGRMWDPDFMDPVFLQKLDEFLTVMARRYDGNPNVAFIDIGSFGMWGEGHTGRSSRLSEPQTKTAVLRHTELYLRQFKQTLLVLNDDMVVSRQPDGHYAAVDYALAHGVTLRDDSIMVRPPPNAWHNAAMAQDFWPTLPVILETGHYGTTKERNAWSGELLLKSVEDYHASYMSVHWWPRELLNENREAIDRVNLRLGYRLQPREMSWPRQVSISTPFTVETKWANAGVAPCYEGGFWALTLKDDNGGIVSVNVNEGFDVRQLKPGPPGQAPVQSSSAEFIIGRMHQDPLRTFGPTTKPGTCEVFISVGRRDGTPRIALPLPNSDGQLRYKLGTMRVNREQ
jgi:hypothetical protein